MARVPSARLTRKHTEALTTWCDAFPGRPAPGRRDDLYASLEAQGYRYAGRTGWHRVDVASRPADADLPPLQHMGPVLLDRLGLPWPDWMLSANRATGRHWTATHEDREMAKKTARLLTRQAIGPNWAPVAGPVQLHLALRPPGGRGDWDNAVSALKPTQDGIFAALGMDDSQIRRVVIDWLDPVDPGAVFVTLSALV